MVDANRFVGLVEQGPSSMSAVTFLGTDGTRAYLAYWSMGVLGGDTHDVYSVAIDDLPAVDRDALRAGREPWTRTARTNDPGLRPAELDALATTARFPPRSPVVVALRCATGQPAQVARDHFDRTFTDDTIVPVPVPCSLVLLVTAAETATVRVGETELRIRVPPEATGADWLRLDSPGETEVVVRGSASTWRVRPRGVPAATFY